MSTVYEYQKVRQRKFLYAGIIVLLFILGLVHRLQVLEASAKEHSLEVSNLGQVDMGGELSRYLLASFRGPLICGLWWEANEKQARHEYDQMEVLIEALTKLQPHFKGPWKFQGWNLAYNVAVEYDRVEDKYYYVARGIRWYYEGDRINVARLYDPELGGYRSVGEPDLRKDLAYTVENKMYRADEGEYYRCFLQLSCIDPDQRTRGDRDERRYTELLNDFMVKYPILTRRIQRLREVPDGDQAQLRRELRGFLEQYADSERRGNMPSRYRVLTEQEERELNDRRAAGTLSDADARRLRETPRPFPVWPPGLEPNYAVEREPAGTAKSGVERYHHVQDGYDIARRWYEYAQEPLPPPNADWSRNYDPRHGLTRFYRLHKQGTTIHFRSMPPKMRSHLARYLADTGWKRDSLGAWDLAFDEWLAFGRANGIEKSDAEWKALSARMEYYYDRNVRLGDDSPDLRPPPEALRGTAEYERQLDGFFAVQEYRRLAQQRRFAHYDHWRSLSEISSRPGSGEDLAQARYHWYRASRLPGDPQAALEEYRQGVALWRKVMGPTLPATDRLLRATDLLTLGLPLAGGPYWSPAQILTRDLLLTPGLRQAQLATPTSPFTGSDQLQTELARLQADYLATYARRQAPHCLASQHVLLRLGHGLAPLAGQAPLGVAALQAAQPALGMPGAGWVTVERVEDWLETMPDAGPFTPYFSEGVLASVISQERNTSHRSFWPKDFADYEEQRRRALEASGTGAASVPLDAAGNPQQTKPPAIGP